MDIKERIKAVSKEIDALNVDLHDAYETLENREDQLLFLRGRLEELLQIEREMQQ